MKQSVDKYFQNARSWADDVYLEALASRNRYRFAFLWTALVILLLIIAFIFLLPLQHTKLVVVHHMNDGTSWSELSKSKKEKISKAQIESDIVRYVVNRESYSPASYDYHYSLVNLLSSKKIATDYQRQQSASNPKSPINLYKHRVVRKVHIQNVIFLKNAPQSNLAQVNFVINEEDSLTGRLKKRSKLALVSWRYRGVPKDPENRWRNWNGFNVIHYSVQQRNV